jgi:hypothetical protein
MKANHDYQIGDKVLFPSVDNAPFEVVGVRPDHLEIKGDFSGGTHNVVQTDWVAITELEHYQEASK